MANATRTRRPINRIRGIDWTHQKSVELRGDVPAETTIGELAESLRERMGLQRGSYSVYYQEEKLPRSATIEEVELPDAAELELSPEVKAAGD